MSGTRWFAEASDNEDREQLLTYEDSRLLQGLDDLDSRRELRLDTSYRRGYYTFCRYKCAFCCTVFSMIGSIYLVSLGVYVSVGWSYIEGVTWTDSTSKIVASNALIAAFMYFILFLFSLHTMVHYPQGRVLSLNLFLRSFDLWELIRYPNVIASTAVVLFSCALFARQSAESFNLPGDETEKTLSYN
mmetsp:Transcript_17587/g.23027  ORF Transcript_17587/g.23027 Transcript_17587/m.23027 type:complete len:188 (+) Transcript_17587:396-959(+)